MNRIEVISRFWPHLSAICAIAAFLASAHALLHKRDPRAAALWIGIIWLVPALGPILYLILGINRIRRHAVSLGVHKVISRPIPENFGEPEHMEAQHLRMLSRVVSRVVAQPLTPGNTIHPLINGDEVFPAMLAAIDSARQSISLCTYIFDNDATGAAFVSALSRAVKRGVRVCVLVDAAGARYSWPSIMRKLRHEKIPCARFLPSSLLAPWRVATINLRNHRKILVLDGKIGFSGGINIRQGNVLADNPRRPIQDLHFRIEGPAVVQLQEAFVNDWAFTTGETLESDDWFPQTPESGAVVARIIADGPDADFEKLRWTLLSALAESQTSVQIVTPYFLPDSAMITALNLAALRGVRVDILLPSRNNLPVVHWASRSMWWQVLERGCHVWLTPPPFDHSKLMIVDAHWVLIGSANWDARSLRLNFELNIECYGRDFATHATKIVQQKLKAAREITLEEVNRRTIAMKLWDAAARLFAPFL